MKGKYTESVAGRARQGGFTLVELMIAMLISLTLVFACTSLYSSLKDSIQVAQGLATAQESLRSSFYLLSRSVRQAQSFAISGASDTVLITTYDAPPASSAVYSCLGNEVTVSGSKDTFTFTASEGFKCDDGSGAQLIALEVESLQFEKINDDGLKVTMEIDGMPTSYTDGLTFTLALRQKVLLDLSD